MAASSSIASSASIAFSRRYNWGKRTLSSNDSLSRTQNNLQINIMMNNEAPLILVSTLFIQLLYVLGISWWHLPETGFFWAHELATEKPPSVQFSYFQFSVSHTIVSITMPCQLALQHGYIAFILTITAQRFQYNTCCYNTHPSINDCFTVDYRIHFTTTLSYLSQDYFSASVTIAVNCIVTSKVWKSNLSPNLNVYSTFTSLYTYFESMHPFYHKNCNSWYVSASNFEHWHTWQA